MEEENEYAELIELLEERGHTEPEIQKILARVHHYEKETQADSVMDSIANGRFSLDAIIEDALAE